MSDIQVETAANEQYRPASIAFRAFYLTAKARKAARDDVAIYLNGAGSGWVDTRTDGVPHLLTANDMLALIAFDDSIISVVEGTLGSDAAKASACNIIASGMPIVLKACIQPAFIDPE